MFRSLDARPMEWSEYGTPRKRAIAVWGAACWGLLALAQPVFLLVRRGQGLPRTVEAVISACILLLVAGWGFLFRDLRRLEAEISARGDAAPGLLAAYRRSVRLITVTAVAAIVTVTVIRWTALWLAAPQ